MQNKNLDKLINQALLMEAEEAREAGSLGFMARALIQATLPHKQTKGTEFTRTNGAFTLTLLAPSRVGLPYGTIPRLLLSWITTEAVRTKQRELELGDSLAGFMEELGMIPTGGRWGSITRLKDQMARLFSSSVTCTYDDGASWALESVTPIDSARLWWSPSEPEQVTLWKSTITLGERFFNEVTRSPVPIDMRALKALKKSPLALDIYLWLTYRMSYLKRPTEILWTALQAQFGSEYAENAQGSRDFKRAFLKALKKIELVYPEARVEKGLNGLILFPSRPHITKRG